MRLAFEDVRPIGSAGTIQGRESPGPLMCGSVHCRHPGPRLTLETSRAGVNTRGRVKRKEMN